MHRAKFILIALLAVLTACFTIELPFTQVNYIHLLVSKKGHYGANSHRHTITGSVRDTHRLHKTYYEDAGSSCLPPPALSSSPIIFPLRRAPQYPPCHCTIDIANGANALRGPPALG